MQVLSRGAIDIIKSPCSCFLEASLQLHTNQPIKGLGTAAKGLQELKTAGFDEHSQVCLLHDYLPEYLFFAWHAVVR